VTDREAKGSCILVATDFSDDAAAAYAVATDLARPLNTTVTVLHVCDARDDVWQEAHAAWLGEVGLARDGLIRRGGVPWLEILQLSEDLPASLVVIGRRGQSAGSIQVPGSTTLSLIHYSRVPVLVVPASSPPADRGARYVPHGQDPRPRRRDG
jgi:nucleotide-binding universal stress UspA family protein